MAKIRDLSTSFLATVLRGDKRAQQFSFVDDDGSPVTRVRIVDELRARNEESVLVEQEDARALVQAGF